MGIKNIVVDDLTGQELPADTKPVDVRVDGDDYSVYLSDESMETFVSFLKGEGPLVRTATPTRRRGTRTTSNAAEVRAWAKDQGMKVPDRGRIPQEVMDKWNAK